MAIAPPDPPAASHTSKAYLEKAAVARLPAGSSYKSSLVVNDDPPATGLSQATDI
jgi:hypothetical protein